RRGRGRSDSVRSAGVRRYTLRMRRVTFLLLLSLAIPLHAADLELGIRHLSMTAMGDSAFDGGKLEIVTSRGFGATAEVFWTPRVSTQLAATFLNPAAF